MSPVSVPDSSFLWRTPKSASLRGSSLHERGLWLNIKLEDNQRARNHMIVTRHKRHFDLQYLGNNSNLSTLSALNLPVSGTVHGLQCKDVILHREGEHVFAVVLPMARCLPQFAVIDVGGGYFLEASSPILILEQQQNHINKLNTAAVLHRYFMELS